MRVQIMVLLLACLPAWAADPPKIVLLSPAPPVATVPPAVVNPAVPVDGFRWYGVGNYTGNVTWRLRGDAAKKHDVIKDMTILDWTDGGKPPVEQTIVAGSALLRGMKAGKVELEAWGVVDAKAVLLAALVIDVGPRGPPVDPVDPVDPDPVPTNILRFLYVGKEGQPADPAVLKSMSLPAWAPELKAERVKYLPLDKVPTVNGKSPLPDGTKLPCLLVLSEGPTTSKIIPPPRALPTTDAEVETLRKEKP